MDLSRRPADYFILLVKSGVVQTGPSRRRISVPGQKQILCPQGTSHLSDSDQTVESETNET
jgi:hypothetical protein